MPLYMTNIASMSAMRTLNNVTSELDTVFQRLASGKRINSAKDDPAGLMIADRLTAQINGYKQGSRNLNDGISVAQTMEHALDESKNMLQRIRTLAIQAASGTYTDEDRAAMDLEAQELCNEINRISNSTTFGGAQILSGNTGGLFSSNGSIDIQCTGNVGDKISIPGFADGFSISGMASYLQISDGESYFKVGGGSLSFSLTSASNAESVLGCIDKYINTVSSYQARLGAVQNRMESAIRNNSSMYENLSDARSRIEDTDYAEEASKLAELMVRQQVIASLFSRIINSKSIILSLLGS
ncbi:flagellin [Succinivibrio dextrinosolvens]|uniref:flagellin N-terminal helical domain-containing protein n=1 Tax=Succinivibrio dextrinosolvens TaxID=83771 RepID=UPI0008EE0E61|nr:flagellin [Succinivibrio dextrinosolvens]SFS36762.1 flagellin [Succinivibrio dextrinosolvens]